ncbi:MAG: cbb3-type cytochrome c oxidase subunit 3 [Pseudomonadota bacterium]
MDTYSILREFADSWFLLAMFSFFVGTILWLCLPAQKKGSKDASGIPFRDTQDTETTDPKGTQHG